ncbi:hypothetical protein GCM10018965_003910 [Nonomuraea roseola]
MFDKEHEAERAPAEAGGGPHAGVPGAVGTARMFGELLERSADQLINSWWKPLTWPLSSGSENRCVSRAQSR